MACAGTAAFVGVLNGLQSEVPPNAGTLRPIEVRLRGNCYIGIARHPVSTSVATTNLGDRVTNAVQLAIAGIDPRIGTAEGAPVYRLRRASSPAGTREMAALL